MISNNRIRLSSPDDRKNSGVVWVWAGIIFVIVGIIVFAVRFSDDGEVVSQAKPIYIEDFGTQEWEKLADISRQSIQVESSVPENERQKSAGDDEDPFLIHGKIKKNQTLFAALRSHGLDVSDIHQIIAAMQTVVDFKKTRPGDKYEVQLDVDKRILKFTYIISPEDISIAERNGNEYVASKVDVHKKVERIVVSGVLASSLYQAFVDLGESGELAAHFMQLFKYDIDFGNDSQQGDEFSVLVDKVTLNGQFYRYERVWAATYRSGAKKRMLEAYYYDSQDDYAGYYDADGNALKKTFLKTPVVGCFISSPYNPKRMHPVLKRIRPHNGTDWACNTGTPVMAFADGVVTYADWKGGNGNLLVIEHAHGYTSLYAHLYTFARGIKPGAKVKQGQVVAQVGNTGISTGPHLHFAVKINGKYTDPVLLDSRHSFTLGGSRLHQFMQGRDRLRQNMQELFLEKQAEHQSEIAAENDGSTQNGETKTAENMPEDLDTAIAVDDAQENDSADGLTAVDQAVLDIGSISGDETPGEVRSESENEGAAAGDILENGENVRVNVAPGNSFLQ